MTDRAIYKALCSYFESSLNSTKQGKEFRQQIVKLDNLFILHRLSWSKFSDCYIQWHQKKK